jgi:hypothetical protein
MPAQMVVVTDNRSLSLALTGLDYDVVDLHPEEFAAWLTDETEPPALVVVGVEQPADAFDIVASAAAGRTKIPMLVVSSTVPGWDAFASPGDHVTVLPLPVTRTSLVAAAERLIAAAAPPAVVAAPPVPVPAPATPAPPTPDRAPRHMVAARSTDVLRQRLAQRAGTTNGAPPGEAAHPSFDAAALRTAADEPEAAPARRATSHRQVHDAPAELRVLVEGVLRAVDELYDVRDAATAVVVESLAATNATSGVVLLPDGEVWRVAGAAGVRPLEWRYVVEPDSWLLTTVVAGDRGVIVEDSDIARQRLSGAPLAHHPQLLAAPIPQARGLVLIGRETGAFTEKDLSAVADIASDADSVLVDALRVRDLARALSDFRALVD